MKKHLTLLFLVFVVLAAASVRAQTKAETENLLVRSPDSPRIGFVIHGGAGVIRRGNLSPEREKLYRAKLREAVLAGYSVLKQGKSGLDAVEVAVRILEDSPLFNAGKGSVFTADGKNELDAAVMDGKTLNAGAVAGLRRVKNPITLARAIMEKSPHVMMIGTGAEEFGREMNLGFVPESYFRTERRWKALQRRIEREKQKSKGKAVSAAELRSDAFDRYGTVGAVALDRFGNVAAGTSTGGMTYKKYGRVGDVPVIGAGTYADNRTCAVSATGHGEYFIRLNVAKDISALMEYKGLSVQQAADQVIHKKLQGLGGDGGVIAIDKNGNIGVSFNSEGMYRAYIDKEGKPVVEIYKNE